MRLYAQRQRQREAIENAAKFRKSGIASAINGGVGSLRLGRFKSERELTHGIQRSKRQRKKKKRKRKKKSKRRKRRWSSSDTDQDEDSSDSSVSSTDSDSSSDDDWHRRRRSRRRRRRRRRSLKLDSQSDSSEGRSKSDKRKKHSRKYKSDKRDTRNSKLSSGEKVSVNYGGKGKYYPGKISRKNSNGTYDIEYDDGDRERGVKRSNIKVSDNVGTTGARNEVSTRSKNSAASRSSTSKPAVKPLSLSDFF